MCGPKLCPMHNFRDVYWVTIRAVVAERKRVELSGSPATTRGERHSARIVREGVRGG
jgi:hypothetical protein